MAGRSAHRPNPVRFASFVLLMAFVPPAGIAAADQDPSASRPLDRMCVMYGLWKEKGDAQLGLTKKAKAYISRTIASFAHSVRNEDLSLFRDNYCRRRDRGAIGRATREINAEIDGLGTANQTRRAELEARLRLEVERYQGLARSIGGIKNQLDAQNAQLSEVKDLLSELLRRVDAGDTQRPRTSEGPTSATGVTTKSRHLQDVANRTVVGVSYEHVFSRPNRISGPTEDRIRFDVHNVAVYDCQRVLVEFTTNGRLFRKKFVDSREHIQIFFSQVDPKRIFVRRAPAKVRPRTYWEVVSEYTGYSSVTVRTEEDARALRDALRSAVEACDAAGLIQRDE